jgi:hypothetical protein
MRRTYLPPSPLAPRQVVSFDVRDPEQARAALSYWKRRLAGLARDRSEFPSEFDRLIADTEAWCQDVAAAAGLRPDQAVSDELYPEAIWYAARISTRAAEIRHLRDHHPDLALGLALFLGELIGEARAHLTHGVDAARGVKAMQSVRAGHEGAHGSPAVKQARWRAQVATFEKYRAQRLGITEAERRAAEECGVSPRTIYNARRRAQR